MRQSILKAILILVISASAAHADYYSDSKKGFWWGEKEPEKQEPEKTPEDQKPTVQPQQREEKKGTWVPPALQEYSYEDVWNMHPDDFQDLQESFKKKAVQSPTEANVRDYYELQEIARKKALAFSNTAEYVWQRNPQLTNGNDYPTNSPGMLAKIEMSSEERLRVLQSNRANYALVYFTKTGCPYCAEEDNILKWFTSKTGWTVKPVNITQQPDMASRFGVEITPTLILIKKGESDFMPVSAGIATSKEIEEQTYRAVRVLNGDVSPEEFTIRDYEKGGGYDVNYRKDWLKK
jgi:conjugal transfer pilus assembly protein TraF